MRDFEECKIKREIDGYTDPETGQWVDGGEETIAEIIADIQPQTGQRREMELQTDYESDYIAFVYKKDIDYKEKPDNEEYYSEIQKGDVLEDDASKKYDIVFPANWKTHLEIELEAV